MDGRTERRHIEKLYIYEKIFKLTISDVVDSSTLHIMKLKFKNVNENETPSYFL